jgi:SAM-dependent methyltransferase
MRNRDMSGDIESKKIQAAIRGKYVDIARSIEGRFRYPTGKAGAEAQGYDATLTQSASGEALHYFCGVGNPFSLGPINPGETFDVILSNGTLNLSPEKEKSFAEIYRVLKPAGRLQFADMVLRAEGPPEKVTAKAWSE